MKPYFRINAPLNPIIDNFEYPSFNEYGYHFYDKSIIRSEIIDYFKEVLDLEIYFVFLINIGILPPRPERKNQCGIHSDVTWYNNKWNLIHYSVNYELTDTPVKLTWWNINEEEIYPPPPTFIEKHDYTRGIHYGKSHNMDALNENYKEIYSVDLLNNTPLLVNNRIPHSVNYFGLEKPRRGLTIRFTKVVSDWGEAVNMFKKVIID